VEDDLLQVRREKVEHILVFAGFILILLLVVDGGESAKEQVTGVGHDGGTARGDALLRLEEEKPGEEVVDGDGGLEFGETGDELGGETGGMVAFPLAASVFSAERGERVCDGHAAATVARVVLAAALTGCGEDVGIVERIRVNDCGGHVVPRFSVNFWLEMPTPPGSLRKSGF
jgi:hypothetical protein